MTEFKSNLKAECLLPTVSGERSFQRHSDRVCCRKRTRFRSHFFNGHQRDVNFFSPMLDYAASALENALGFFSRAFAAFGVRVHF